ncbi:hypothetical protein ON010_g11978 [Phytophthora cinnamomi]|nr:hypothetical protein ON010_g11978 [Phytophthora cinnamomi]
MLHLMMALLALLVGGEALSAPAADSQVTLSSTILSGESRGVRADIDAKRSLRGLKATNRASDAEERGMSGLAEKVKVWATKSKLGQKAQAWMQMRKEVKAAQRLELAKELIAKKAKVEDIYRQTKITPDDYFNIMGFRHRYRFASIPKTAYLRYPGLKKWETYEEYYHVIRSTRRIKFR